MIFRKKVRANQDQPRQRRGVFKNLKLGVKLTVAFLVAGLLPMGVVGYVAVQQARRALVEQAESKLTALVEVKRSELNNFYQKAQRDVANMGKNPFIIQAYNDLEAAVDAGSGEDSDYAGKGKGEYEAPEMYKLKHEEIVDALNAYTTTNGYDDLFLIRKDQGKVLFSSQKNADFGQSIAEHKTLLSQVYQAALKGETSISDMQLYSPANKQPRQFIAAPILEEGEVLGIVAIAISPKPLNAITAEVSGLGDTGTIYLLGSDLTMRSDMTRGEKLDEFSVAASLGANKPLTSSLTTMAQADQSDSRQYRGVQNYDAATVVGASQSLDLGTAIKWLLVAEMHENEALQAVTNLRNLLLAMLLGVSVVVLAAAWWLSRQVTRPIYKCVHFAQTLAKGDLSHRLELETFARDEIGELATALNMTTETLGSIISDMVTNSQTLSSASTNIFGAANLMADSARQVANQSASVSSASQELTNNMSAMTHSTAEVSKNIKFVAHSVEEMKASIGEVAKNAEQAASVARQTAELARDSNNKVMSLGTNADEIGKVIEVIQDIAEQTNLLALNATIEAARAGDAGKGFAVVAHEVKDLAKQTSSATDGIRKRIEAIQASTSDVVEAIARINESIGNVNATSTSIAGAVEEQSITTRHIADKLQESAQAAETVAQAVSESAAVAKGIADNIHQVDESIHTASQGAESTQLASQDLGQIVSALSNTIGHFTTATSAA